MVEKSAKNYKIKAKKRIFAKKKEQKNIAFIN